MNSIQVLVVVAVMFVGLAAAQTKYTDCGSKVGTINNLNVTGCTTSPCIAKKGTNMTFELDFTAHKAITQAKAVVHARALGFWVPFHLPDPNACHFMSCPVASGSVGKYKASLPISTSYPSISIIVKWEIQDSDGEVTCFEIPVKVE